MFWELLLCVQKDSRGKNIEDLIAISISLQNTATIETFISLRKNGMFFRTEKKKGIPKLSTKKIILLFPEMRVTKKIFGWATSKKKFINLVEFFK